MTTYSFSGALQAQSGGLVTRYVRVKIGSAGLVSFQNDNPGHDSYIALFTSTGSLVGSNDNGSSGNASELSLTLQPGDYFLAITDASATPTTQELLDGVDGPYAGGGIGFSTTITDAGGVITSAVLEGGETLTGTSGDDVIYGLSGDDVINAGGGSNTVYGGTGNDTISLTTSGAVINNHVYGGEGDDTLNFTGSAGVTSFDGGAGIDTLHIDATSAISVTQTGDVYTFNGQNPSGTRIDATNYERLILTGGDSGDNIQGTGGDDNLFGARGDDTLRGGAGNDTITGGSGFDSLFGGDGDDFLDGSVNLSLGGTTSSGGNSLTGGTGNDIYIIYRTADSIVELAGEGIDEVRTDNTNYTLPANVENLVGMILPNDTNAVANQSLTGNALDNVITGGPGNDTLNGLDGNDTLDGGAGGDQMSGGLGNDIYYVNQAGGPPFGFGDVVVENAGEGIDEIRVTLGTYTLDANVENLTGLSATGQTLYGNSLNNVIAGGAGDDAVNAMQGGHDTVTGGAGNDILTIDTTVPGGATYSVTDNPDGTKSGTVDYSGSHIDFSGFERLSILSASGSTVISGGADDTYTFHGTNATDAGLTTVDLDGGTDTVIADFSQVTDYTVFTTMQQAGHTVFTVGGTNNQLDITNVEKLQFTGGAQSDNITGLAGDDVMNGQGGNDTLYGGTGNDTLDGGGGDDIVYGAEGDDVITASIGNDNVYGLGGTDRLVVDYSAATAAVTGGTSSGSLTDGTSAHTVSFTGIENFSVTTGAGNDSVTFTSGDNLIQLSGGDDFVNAGTSTGFYDGGTGIDGVSADLSASSAAIQWNLVANTTANTPATFTRFEYFGTLTTGSGSDTIVTGLGNHDETVNSGDGNDTVKVFGGSDTVNGGLGDDGLIVDYSDATSAITGGLGNGYLTDGTSAHTVSFSGVEYFNITTGSGDDTIQTGAERDTVSLGAGNDFVNIGATTIGDTADGGTGTDGISADLSAFSNNMLWNLVTNTFSGIGTFTNFEYFGTLSMGAGNDLIVSGLGSHDETINAGDGNDSVKVFGGSDNVSGGLGSDTLVVDYSDSVNAITGGVGNGYFTDGAATHTVNFTGIERFDITTGGANDSVTTGTGNDVVHAGGGADQVDVGSGNDTADGGDGIDRISADLSAAAGAIVWNLLANAYSGPIGSFTNFEYFGTISTGSGNDTIVSGTGVHDETINAGGGDDTIKVFGGSDTVNGDTGNDTLIADYSDAVNAVTGGAGNGYFTDGSGAHTVNFTGIEAFDVTGGASNDVLTGGTGNDRFFGNDGADQLTGGGGDDYLDGGAGVDTMTGGTGNDVYLVDMVGDQVIENANEGVDEIRTTLATFDLASVANVENLTFTGTGNADLRGNSGNNIVTGNNGDDLFRLQDGGNDTAYGGDGNDGFYFGAAFTAADHVDGGAGANDQVAIQGDYILTLGATTLTGVETLALLSHSNATFGGGSAGPFTYYIEMNDANVVAGQNFTVNANSLEAGEVFVFNGSAETDGTFRIYAGFGHVDLTGGAGSDGFFFGEGGRFDATDRVNGGSGRDDQIGLRGNYASQIVFQAGTMHNVDTIAVLTAHGVAGAEAPAYSYNLKTDDGNLAAGDKLTVTGVLLAADEHLTFDGSAETDGHFDLRGGAGTDTLIGGHQSDSLFGGLGADQLTGGEGNDTFLFRSAGESTASAQDDVLDFTSGDVFNLSTIDADTTTCGNQAFNFIGTSAFAGHAGELRVEDQGGGSWLVQGDVDGDGIADLQIHVTVTDSHILTGADFVP